MGFLAKVLKTKTSKSSIWSEDILNRKSVRLFFETKIAISSYIGAIGVNKKRELSQEVKEVLTKFIELKLEEEEIKFFEEILSTNNKNLDLKRREEGTPLEVIASINKEGADLLNISDDINLKSLNKLYRKAAIINHPDMGGSTEKMQKINAAYAFFVDFLNKRNNKDEGENTSNANTFLELLFSCNLVLSCIHGDDFAADHSYEYLKKSFTLKDDCSESYVSSFTYSLIRFACVISRPCKALGRLKMEKQLVDATKITMIYLSEGHRHFTKYIENLSAFNHFNVPNEIALKNEFGAKIVIKSLIQAENLYRLKAIDKKRYDKARKKYKKQSLIFQEEIKNLSKFYKSLAPAVKIDNHSYQFEKVSTKIVPPTSYSQDRFHFLSNEQKQDYIDSFTLCLDSSKILNYIEIRTNDILLAIINNFKSLDLFKIKKELIFLDKQIPTAEPAYSAILDFIQSLEDMNQNKRREKLLLLKDLDDLEEHKLSDSALFSYNLDEDLKKRIVSSFDYLRFAKSPISKIENFIKTGDILTRNLENEEKLDDFRKSMISIKRNQLISRNEKTSSSEAIKIYSEYIKRILQISKEFDGDELAIIRIGYDFERLTTLLAKEKKWTELVHWGSLFFSLRKEYRSMSSASEQNKIRARIERALKSFKKAS